MWVFRYVMGERQVNEVKSDVRGGYEVGYYDPEGDWCGHAMADDFMTATILVSTLNGGPAADLVRSSSAQTIHPYGR